MKTNFSPSGSEPDIESLWNCYNVSRQFLNEMRPSLLADYDTGKTLPATFLGMRKRQIEEYLTLCEKELDYATCLQLSSAVEAWLRLDFLSWVNKPRPKSKIDRVFQDIFAAKGSKVNIEEDILDSWKAHKPACINEIGQFKQILPFRHWLAHGRYWQPRFPKYSPIQVYTIGKGILDCLNNE